MQETNSMLTVGKAELPNTNGDISLVVSSIPFAPIVWWQRVNRVANIGIDIAEHYQKMSLRNRYHLAGANGRQLLSIPLERGRNQRIPVAEVKIAYADNWQAQHWKTITSLYKRSPFFEYIEHKMAPLYQERVTYLHEWNMRSMALINSFLSLNIHWHEITEFEKHYIGNVLDYREESKLEIHEKPKEYYQVFKDRTGFIQECSILDLIFCEGLAARDWLT